MATCAYCGIWTDKPELDHVIPQAIWGGTGHLPQSMITVPACEPCHKHLDQDIEYFRNVLTVVIDRKSNPVVDRLLETKTVKSISRNKNAFADLVRNLRAFEYRQKSGLILGMRTGFELDMDRFSRPLKKIVRGLFYYKSHAPLPKGYDVEVFDGNEFWSSQGFHEWLEEWEPAVGCGDHQFLMRCTRDSSDHNITAWLLQFYGQVSFLAWTIPSDFGQQEILAVHDS